MLLTVDIGNTHIVMGVFQEEKLIEHWRISTELKKTRDEYAITLRNLFALSNLEPSGIKGAIIGSVVPHLNWTLKKSIAHLFGIDALVLTYKTPIGLENRYENPREVGMDRLANAVGAKTLLGYPVIIVDFGTAITLDVVDRDGAYAGGVILPGLEMGADSLFKRTSKLPRISLLRPHRVLGRNTVASMQSGLLYGTAGAVYTLIERLWRELGYETKVIATGGSAADVIAELPHIDKTDLYLTLRGLRTIWLLNNG